jgi:hypothetical protein
MTKKGCGTTALMLEKAEKVQEQGIGQTIDFTASGDLTTSIVMLLSCNFLL